MGGIICIARKIDVFIYNKKITNIINIINKRGPIIDPCGTPNIILSNSLNNEPTLVVCVRFFRYELITFNEVSSKS